MPRVAPDAQYLRCLTLAAAFLVSACGKDKAGPALTRMEEGDAAIPSVPVPPENGPRLGAIASMTEVLDRPSRKGHSLGYLHAGDTVARSTEPVSTAGCDVGWYAVRPVGFVCASGSATLDTSHPTLSVMSVRPSLESALPYTYARTVRDATLYEVDPSRDVAVHEVGTVRARSGLAIVGSWSAANEAGKPLRLALTTEGKFLTAADLESAQPSAFRGVELSGGRALPLAFVVKRGVHSWTFRDESPEKGEALPYHAELDLGGKRRKISGVEFVETKDGRWVRTRDVTVVLARHELPPFAEGDQKWLDVSVVTGTLVAYTGQKPWFVTLVSVGQDRLGAPGSSFATERGELDVVGKHVTFVGRDPASFMDGASIYDAPWVLELSSGQVLVGAYWHDRFGIEHGPGNLELSPADAARLFQWATPPLPTGWHAVRFSKGSPRTIVNVRK